MFDPLILLRNHGWKVKALKFIDYLFQLIRYNFMLIVHPGKVNNLNYFERKVFSQNGEDGLLQYIFIKIKTTNKYFIEIGAGDGGENNSHYLLKLGWRGLQIDGKKSIGIKNHFVTAQNVEKFFKENNVPNNFDLLSIDIDGMDYWVWKAITNYHPRVVVIEYNASVSPINSTVVPYNPHFVWDDTDYFGASLGALNKLALSKGYQLVATNSNGINAIFVNNVDVKKILLSPMSVSEIYHPPKFRLQTDGTLGGHPQSHRLTQMISV